MDILIRNYLNNHTRALTTLAGQEEAIKKIAALSIHALNNKGKIIFMGNGGSAADAQHLAAELIGRFKQNRKAFAAIALSTNTSILTAVGNDFGFDEIFTRQIEGLAWPNDIVFGISTSGNSKNVIKGIEKAKALGIKTVGLLGKDGGELKKLVDLDITISGSDTPHVQEMHILVGHLICEIIEQSFTAK